MMSALELTMIATLVLVIVIKLALMTYAALLTAGSVMRPAPAPISGSPAKLRRRTAGW